MRIELLRLVWCSSFTQFALLFELKFRIPFSSTVVLIKHLFDLLRNISTCPLVLGTVDKDNCDHALFLRS